MVHVKTFRDTWQEEKRRVSRRASKVHTPIGHLNDCLPYNLFDMGQVVLYTQRKNLPYSGLHEQRSDSE